MVMDVTGIVNWKKAGNAKVEALKVMMSVMRYAETG
jgi:hypothetical protein